MTSSDTGIYEIVVKVVSISVTAAVFIISNTISLYLYFNSAYPEYTLTVLGIFGIYIAYRLSIRMMKSWINMVIFMIKLTIFVVAVISGLAIYLRGSRFIEQDVPYFQQVILSYDGGSILDHFKSGFNKYMFSSFMDLFRGNKESTGSSKSSKSSRSTRSKKDAKKFQKKAKKVMNEYGIEIDEDILDYMNEHINPEEPEFIQNLNDALGNLGVDMNKVGEFMSRFQ